MPWKKMLTLCSGEIETKHKAVIDYLLEENQRLHRQITRRILLTDDERRTLAEKAVAMGKLMADYVTIVKPDTILKWHRQLVATKFDGSKVRNTHGRPAISTDIEKMVLAMAHDNPTWGYDKISGALDNLGHKISASSVANILTSHGVSPAPKRKKTTTWNQFIRQHKDVLLATDFFATEIWTSLGLTTYYVLFFIHIQSRRIVISGATDHPTSAWVEQCARNVTDWDCPLPKTRYILHDRDTKYTKAFDNIFSDVDIKPIKLPPSSPNLNAFAERFVRSIKSECLDRMILFGERSLKHVLKEYQEHYHSERNHQGIGNVVPFPDERLTHKGEIIKSERLGGLLNFYHRRAA